MAEEMEWAAWSPLFWPIDEGNINVLFWLYAEPYLAALRQSYRLRGALTPYTYTLAWRSATESWPYIRPMWYEHPRASVSPSQAASQFFFGSVLVRPVASWYGTAAKRGSQVSVWLPRGDWISWSGDKHFTGPANVSLSVALSETPLFVPAGFALPMWPPGRREEEPNQRPTMWVIWKQAALSGSGITCDS